MTMDLNGIANARLVLLTLIVLFLITPVIAIPTNGTTHIGNVLYLTMNGTSGSTSFIDQSASPHTITPNGDVSVSSNQGYFYNSSIFDGSGDYLSVAYTPDLNFSSSDYYVSSMYRFTALPSDGNEVTLWSEGIDSSNFARLNLYNDVGTYRLYLYVLNTSTIINTFGTTTSTGIITDTWYKIDVVKNGTSTLVLVDNTTKSYANTTYTIPDFKTPLFIGAGYNGVSATNYISAYTDELVLNIGNAYIPNGSVREYLTNPTLSFVANSTSGETPLPVQITDTALGNTPFTYGYRLTNVSGNNTELGEVTTLESPLITFNVGDWLVNRTVYGRFGSSSAYAFVNVSQPGSLIADFIANSTKGYPNDYVQFTDTTGDIPITWNWSFGDGGNSTTQNPIHQYVSVGLYNVSLNVTNSTSYNSTTKYGYIKIETLPLPSNLTISANNTYSTDTTLPVAFNTIATNYRFSYRNLSFGDGTWYNTSIELDNSTTHTYTSVGDYTVTLYETNAAGTASNASIDYIVLSDPTLVMYPQDLPISRGITGLMTLRISNLSHVDGGASNITFNKTAITIDSITANTTSSRNFTVTSNINNTAGIASIGISCVDVSSTSSNVDIVDIVWRANTTKTNDTAPVAFNSTAFTSFIKSNSSYNSFRYPNITHLVPGIITLTDNTWVKTLTFKNAYTQNIISGLQLRISWTGQTSGSDTTTSGMYTISSTYGTVSVTGSADGYYNITQTILFNNNDPVTLQMSPLSGAPSQITWYTPMQVRLKLYSPNGTPLENVYVTATPINFTAPADWAQILIGVQPAVNMSGTTLDGWSSTDGSWVAPMLPSYQYQFRFVKNAISINYTMTLQPSQSEYIITLPIGFVPVPTAASNVVSYSINNASITNTTQFINMTYNDGTLGTTYIKFAIYGDNATVLYEQEYSGLTANSVTYSQVLDTSTGRSFTYGIFASQSQYGWINQTETLTVYEGLGILNASPGWVEYWLAVGLLVLFAGAFSIFSIRFAMVSIPLLAYFFQFIMGWFDIGVGGLVTFAFIMAIGVVSYIRQSETKIN